MDYGGAELGGGVTKGWQTLKRLDKAKQDNRTTRKRKSNKYEEKRKRAIHTQPDSSHSSAEMPRYKGNFLWDLHVAR